MKVRKYLPFIISGLLAIAPIYVYGENEIKTQAPSAAPVETPAPERITGDIEVTNEISFPQDTFFIELKKEDLERGTNALTKKVIAEIPFSVKSNVDSEDRLTSESIVPHLYIGKACKVTKLEIKDDDQYINNLNGSIELEINSDLPEGEYKDQLIVMSKDKNEIYGRVKIDIIVKDGKYSLRTDPEDQKIVCDLSDPTGYDFKQIKLINDGDVPLYPYCISVVGSEMDLGDLEFTSLNDDVILPGKSCVFLVRVKENADISKSKEVEFNFPIWGVENTRFTIDIKAPKDKTSVPTNNNEVNSKAGQSNNDSLKDAIAKNNKADGEPNSENKLEIEQVHSQEKDLQKTKEELTIKAIELARKNQEALEEKLNEKIKALEAQVNEIKTLDKEKVDKEEAEVIKNLKNSIEQKNQEIQEAKDKIKELDSQLNIKKEELANTRSLNYLVKEYLWVIVGLPIVGFVLGGCIVGLIRKHGK